MKKSYKIFWIFYFIWAAINVALLIMAFNDLFGVFDKSTEKVWPFSVQSPQSYDFLELLVYLAIPLIVFYIYHLVHQSGQTISQNPQEPLVKKTEADDAL